MPRKGFSAVARTSPVKKISSPHPKVNMALKGTRKISGNLNKKK